MWRGRGRWGDLTTAAGTWATGTRKLHCSAGVGGASRGDGHVTFCVLAGEGRFARGITTGGHGRACGRASVFRCAGVRVGMVGWLGLKGLRDALALLEGYLRCGT